MIFGRDLGMLLRMLVGARFSIGLGLALSLFGVGCTSGTETGNPSIEAGLLSYTGTSSEPEQIGVREGGSVATVKNAWFDLAEVTVSSDGDCGLSPGDTFTVHALGVGDHAAGNHNATGFFASVGTFCSVELPFVRVADSDPLAPTQLQGHAVVLDGELADGTPFTLVSDQEQSVRLQGSAQGFELASNTNGLVAFDFAAWLQDVDFASATVEDGTITISETSNVELLRAFEARLPRGVALYRDQDGDGVLDTDPESLATAP